MLNTRGIEKMVNINLLPYGTSEEHKTSEGNYDYVCNFNLSGCIVNAIEACGVDYFNK